MRHRGKEPGTSSGCLTRIFRNPKNGIRSHRPVSSSSHTSLTAYWSFPPARCTRCRSPTSAGAPPYFKMDLRTSPLGPPLGRLEQEYPFVSSSSFPWSIFARGTLPTQKGVRKGTTGGPSLCGNVNSSQKKTYPSNWLGPLNSVTLQSVPGILHGGPRFSDASGGKKSSSSSSTAKGSNSSTEAKNLRA